MSIFISYSRKDQDYVNNLVEALAKQELPWWVDNKIDYGDQWTKEIKENIKKCQVFLLVMSPNSEESDWVQRELTFAQHLKKPIFPLLLDGEIWFQVINIQIIDVKSGKLPPDTFFNKVRSKLNIQTAQSTAKKMAEELIDEFMDHNSVDKPPKLNIPTAQSTAEEMTEQLFDVFLAYNSVDKPQVKEISNKLRERGLKPWLDEEQIPHGMLFHDEMIPLIKSAAIIIGTQRLGKWQIMELRSLITKFVDRKIPVIPVLLPGVDNIPRDLLFLQELNWVKFEQIDDSTAFYRLEWGITQVKPDLHPKTVQLTAEEWFNLGYNKGESGDYQGAIADYTQAIQLQPDLAAAYYNRGLVKYNLGDKQGAIADYNQAIKFKLDFADAYYNRGIAKSNLGDKQGAIADYNQAAQLYSQQNKMDDYQDALNQVKKLQK
jgi:hypothetical protein